MVCHKESETPSNKKSKLGEGWTRCCSQWLRSFTLNKMESDKILTYYRAWCYSGGICLGLKGDFPYAQEQLEALHRSLCLMVTKVPMAA